MNRCTIEFGGQAPVDCAIEDGESILDGILRSGWEVPYSCRSGACEACRATVVSGGTVPPAADGTALLCRTRARGDVVIRPVRLGRIAHQTRQRLKARVFRVRRVDDDVAVLDLRFPAGTKVGFKPGQYLQVHLAGHTTPRSFSMANASTAADGAQLHVRILPDSVFGAQVVPTLKSGDFLDIELPFGDFYLRDGTAPVILVAGGTGFAPIQSILDSHLAGQPGRSFALYWGAKTASGLYAMDKIEKWVRVHPNFRFVGVVSREDAVGRLRSGRVHEAVLQDYPDLGGHDVLVCGSPDLVTSARAAFVGSRGLAAASFFCDGFAIAQA